MKPKPFILTGAIVAALGLCGLMTEFSASKAAASSPAHPEGGGAVYAMTNALGTNQVLVFARGSNGTLTPLQTINTGGGGSGFQRQGIDSLTSQGGLILDSSHHHLFAVNTETVAANTDDCQIGTISSFLVGRDGRLTLAGRVSSGGLFPDSLTVDDEQLYVLNAGGPGVNPGPACGVGPNITGFRIGNQGGLTAIAGSTRAIDPGSSPGSFLNCDPGGFPSPTFDCGQNPPAFPRAPAQVGFTPDGDSLVVTVKSTNSIYVFPLDGHNHTPGTPTIFRSSGPNQPTYFGFSFDKKGNLVVAEAFGATPTIPAPNAGAFSSFKIGKHDGRLTPITRSLANGQTTPCWVVLDPLTMREAFVSNNNSNDISSYSIDDHGNLTLLAANAATGNGANDMAVAEGKDHDAFLYSNNAGDGTVGAWKINRDGSLTDLGTVGGLPANQGAQGLAAY